MPLTHGTLRLPNDDDDFLMVFLICNFFYFFTNKKINKSCNIHVCVKKPGALTKTTDCHPVSQWIKSISNHVYWCAASTEPGPDRGEVVLAKWQSVANRVQNTHEHPHPAFPRCQHADLPKDQLATTG